MCFARPVGVLTSVLRVGTGAKGCGWHSCLPLLFLSHMGCSMQPNSDHQGKVNNTQVIFWYSSCYFFPPAPFLVLFQAAFHTLNLCLYIIGIRWAAAKQNLIGVGMTGKTAKAQLFKITVVYADLSIFLPFSRQLLIPEITVLDSTRQSLKATKDLSSEESALNFQFSETRGLLALSAQVPCTLGCSASDFVRKYVLSWKLWSRNCLSISLFRLILLVWPGLLWKAVPIWLTWRGDRQD